MGVCEPKESHCSRSTRLSFAICKLRLKAEIRAMELLSISPRRICQRLHRFRPSSSGVEPISHGCSARRDRRESGPKAVPGFVVQGCQECGPASGGEARLQQGPVIP